MIQTGKYKTKILRPITTDTLQCSRL